MMAWLKRLCGKRPCEIVEGGGMLFTDDLWTCKTCGHEKYPEVFRCPRGWKSK